MRVFVTGATGFIGTELVKELSAAGHQVRGLTRSEAGATQLRELGVEVHRGDLSDLESLRDGAKGMDAVVNLAFNHDFSSLSQFAQSGGEEQKAIQVMGDVLEPGKLLVVTSGVGLLQAKPGQLSQETDQPAQGANLPRKPEEAARAIAERGVRVAIVRLPQVHDTRKQGLVVMLKELARAKGISAYVGAGMNRWSAAPLQAVAHLYRLVLEKTGPGVTAFHAVQEQEGVTLKEIATALGQGLGLPTQSLTGQQAAEHFGWLAHFAGSDLTASSEWTQKTLGWHPEGPGLLEDLKRMDYAKTV